MSQEQHILVPVAPGELIDKLTILEIKLENIKDHEKLKNISYEKNILEATLLEKINSSEALTTLRKNLKEINHKLWIIEDDIRDCERKKIFDQPFIDLARAVYYTNDQRCEIKREINCLLGSQIQEEKSYQAY